MGAAVNPVTEPADRVLVITRTFDAPRSLVFKAWTESEHIARWWGPRGFTSKVLKNEQRPGGAYRIHMRGPDGDDHWTQGVYREFVPPERLVFTNIAMDKDSHPIIDGLTTVTFAEHGGKTKLTLQTRATGLVSYAAQMLAGMEAGWTQSLDRLAEKLARDSFAV